SSDLARGVDLGLHGGDHRRVLAHAEVVVGAPDDHFLLRTVSAAAHGLGELPAHALEIGEDAVAPLALHPLDGGLECGLIVVQGVSSAAAKTCPRDAPIGSICPRNRPDKSPQTTN